jgi:hypothetical protein
LGAERLKLELEEEDCVDLSVCSWIFVSAIICLSFVIASLLMLALKCLYHKYDPTQIYCRLRDICR